MSHPSWSQVTVAFSLVAFNSAISHVLQLDIGASLVIAALRCITQLPIVTFILHQQKKTRLSNIHSVT